MIRFENETYEDYREKRSFENEVVKRRVKGLFKPSAGTFFNDNKTAKKILMQRHGISGKKAKKMLSNLRKNTTNA